MKSAILTIMALCFAHALFAETEAERRRRVRPPPPSKIIYAIDPKPGEPHIVSLAIDWAKSQQNCVAVLIYDGHKDKITGKRIAELLIDWFWYDYGLEVRCFVDAPADVPYSGVSYIVGDIPYGPWGLMETKEKIPDIVAAFEANTLMRMEAEKRKASSGRN